MFKIGDFSRLSQVSVKTLRYYDQLGLLKPVCIDRYTGYRYYSADQLPRLNRILAFKDLGFTLEQITQLLDEGVPTAQIRGMFRLKQAEVQQLVESEQTRLARIEARLRQIECEGGMPPYEVVLKTIEPLVVATVRDTIPASNVSLLLDKLCVSLKQYDITLSLPQVVIWHDCEYCEGHMDVEVACPVTLPNNGRVAVHTLPEMAEVACLMHQCSPNTVCCACSVLGTWIEANGYRISETHPSREVYLHQLEGSNSALYMAEAQIPVEKV